MSEASVPRGEALTHEGADGVREPRKLAARLTCLAAGALAFAVPLLWLGSPDRTLGDTLAFAAWAWLLLGLPLLAVLLAGGVRAARTGREPRLIVATQWFAAGLAMGVVLLEAPRLLLQ